MPTMTEDFEAEDRRTTNAEEAIRFANATGLRRMFTVEWIDRAALSGKKPVHRGWQDIEPLTDDQIRRLCERSEMVGVLLDGETFLIDFDKPEVAELLASMTPTTRVEARRGPHLYYRSTDGPVATTRFSGGDVKGTTKRQTPTYAVVPGSWGGTWRLVDDREPTRIAGNEWVARNGTTGRTRREPGEAQELDFLQPTAEQQEAYLRWLAVHINRFNVRSRRAGLAEIRSHVEQFDEEHPQLLEFVRRALAKLSEPMDLDVESHVQDFHSWSPNDTNLNDYLFKQVGAKMWGYGFCEDAILEEIEERNALVEDPIDPDTLHATCGRPGAFEGYERGHTLNTAAWYAASQEVRLIGGVVPERFRIVTAEDRYEKQVPPYLVKGLIHRGTVGQIIGSPGSGKSFLAIDLALSAAHGLEYWMEIRLRARNPVYVAMEGLLDLWMREHAWCLGNGKDLGRLRVVEAPKFTFASMEDVRLISESVGAQGGADLVVVDTQVQAAAGLVEDKAADMTTLFRNAAVLSRNLDAAVVLVHHTGWGDIGRERGSSAQFGAADWQIVVQGGAGGDRSWHRKKLKYGQLSSEDVLFTLEQVGLGFADQDGDEADSAYVAKIDLGSLEEREDRAAGVRVVEWLSGEGDGADSVTRCRQKAGRTWINSDERWDRVLAALASQVTLEPVRGGQRLTLHVAR